MSEEIQEAESILDISFEKNKGTTTVLRDIGGRAFLIVNVASKCGFTPQYEQLEALHQQYHGRGLTVLGFPCNQFGGQEPGTAEDIAAFCSLNYGVTFPVFEKLKVNGPRRAPIYKALRKARDSNGLAGPILWNFEKILVLADGTLRRFRSKTLPNDTAVLAAIEGALE